MTEKVAAEDIPLIQINKSKGKKSICCIYKWKEVSERRLKLTTFLMVLCTVSTIMTLSLGGSIARSITTPPESPSCYYPVPEPSTSSIKPVIFKQLAIAVIFPIIGWLSDTVIGRGKAIKIGLWCNWLGSVLYIVSYCIQYEFCGLSANIAKYGISVLALIIITFGFTISWANIPPYGQDQLVNKSSNQIRAFIYWLIWGLHLGYITHFEYFEPTIIYQPDVILKIGIIVFLFNSIVLILFGTFHHKFKPSGVLKKNPYKSIYEVLKYAVQHKSPTNRSAMTYWEHTAPSRIDLGKEKYGGPFTEDEVEDVKVFWRIFGILTSTFGLHFPMYVAAMLGFVQTFYGAENNFYGSYFFWSFFLNSILVIVPVMLFIVIPLVPKIDYFLVKSLKIIGALYVLMIISMILHIIITIVVKGLPFGNIPVPTVNLPYYWFAIPLLLAGLVDSLRFIFSLEFIISQAPANMSGMLIALFWSLQATFLSLGTLVKLPFSNTGGYSNNVWVYSINLLVLIVGFVVYIVCAWKYKRRQRDDGYYYQNVIEDTYGRILDSEMVINSSSETLEIFSVN